MTPSIHAAVIVIIVALCTLFTRLLPFLVFGRKGEPSPMIQFLGKALPPSVIAILVIYCIKNINFLLPSSIIPQAISITLVVVLHIWKRNNLLSISLGTICYMFLIQYIF
ncbi:MAG: AzlD domain-containing protein [Lachnospiraceae bacterium]|nr:AzlD domain-containing protein [Lachnospiraceae bacterium]